MKSIIKVCTQHNSIIYTMNNLCPKCGADTINSAPPPFSPEDKYGDYRRKTKWKK